MFVDHAAINAGLRLPAIKDCKKPDASLHAFIGA
jgi:hypothetical protein